MSALLGYAGGEREPRQYIIVPHSPGSKTVRVIWGDGLTRIQRLARLSNQSCEEADNMLATSIEFSYPSPQSSEN